MADETNGSFYLAEDDSSSSSDENDNNSSILEDERLKASKEEKMRVENEYQQILEEKVMESEDKLKKKTTECREYRHEIKRLRRQNEELLEQLNNLQKQVGVELTPSLQYPPDIDNEYEYIEFPILTISFQENNNNNTTFSFNDTHFVNNNSLSSSSMLFSNFNRNRNQQLPPPQQQPQQSFANLRDTYNEMISNLSQTFNDDDESITSFLTSFDDLMKAKSNNDKLVKQYKDISLFYTYVNSKQSVIPDVIKESSNNKNGNSNEENEENDEIDENSPEIKQKKNDLVFAIKQLKSLLTDPPIIKKRINNLVKKNQNLLIKLEQLSQSISTILPPDNKTQLNMSELEYIHNCLLKLVECKYNDKIDINSLDKVINEVIEQKENEEEPEELLEHLSKLESLQNQINEEKLECERLYGEYVNNTMDEDNLNLQDDKKKISDEKDDLKLKSENLEIDPLQKLNNEKEELLSSEEIINKYPDINNQLSRIMENVKTHDQLLDEINELKQMVKDLKRQMEDFENEKQENLKKLNIKDPESAQMLLKDLEEEIKNLKEIKAGGDPQNMIENMNKEIENKNTEILRLKDEIEKLKEILQSINNIVNELTTVSNQHDELYKTRNELLSSLSSSSSNNNNNNNNNSKENNEEEEIKIIKQLIDEKNKIAKELDSFLSERNKGNQQVDFLNRFFSLLDENTDIIVNEETKIKNRLIELNITSSFIIDNIDIDKYLNNEENNNNNKEENKEKDNISIKNIINRLKAEVLRINIENKKLLCFINYQLKYKENQKLLEEREKLIDENKKLVLQIASAGKCITNEENGENEELTVYDNDNDKLASSLDLVYNAENERGEKLAEYYKVKHSILEERLKTAQEKVETLTTQMNNQTIDVTQLTKENEILKKKNDKLTAKVEKLNDALVKLMSSKAVNES